MSLKDTSFSRSKIHWLSSFRPKESRLFSKILNSSKLILFCRFPRVKYLDTITNFSLRPSSCFFSITISYSWLLTDGFSVMNCWIASLRFWFGRKMSELKTWFDFGHSSPLSLKCYSNADLSYEWPVWMRTGCSIIFPVKIHLKWLGI